MLKRPEIPKGILASQHLQKGSIVSPSHYIIIRSFANPALFPRVGNHSSPHKCVFAQIIDFTFYKTFSLTLEADILWGVELACNGQSSCIASWPGIKLKVNDSAAKSSSRMQGLRIALCIALSLDSVLH